MTSFLSGHAIPPLLKGITALLPLDSYVDAPVSLGVLEVALFELLVWPHEVEPWFHSWFRGRVDTLDAKYNLSYINSTLCGYTNGSKRAT